MTLGGIGTAEVVESDKLDTPPVEVAGLFAPLLGLTLPGAEGLLAPLVFKTTEPVALEAPEVAALTLTKVAEAALDVGEVPETTVTAVVTAVVAAVVCDAAAVVDLDAVVVPTTIQGINTRCIRCPRILTGLTLL